MLPVDYDYDTVVAATSPAIYGACPIEVSGDVNATGTVNSAEIIALVDYVFQRRAPPSPGEANVDVNCSGSVNSADVIFLVNYVFKDGDARCDVCSMIPALWSCS